MYQRAGATIMVCLIIVNCFIVRNSPSVLSGELMRDLGFSTANLGWISAATMIAFGLFQLPSGILADAFGGRKVLAAQSLLLAGAALYFGLSPSPAQIIAARFMIGVGVAIMAPAMTMMADWHPPHSYGRVTGILMASTSLGAILAATPLVLLFTWITWRGSMICLGLIALGLALGLWFLVPDPPGFRPVTATGPNLPQIGRNIREVLANRSFWPLFIWHTTATGSEVMLLTLWIVPYLTDTFGLPLLQASLTPMLACALTIAAQTGAAFCSDVLLRSRRKVLLPLNLILLGVTMTWVLAGRFLPGLLVMAGIIVFVMATEASSTIAAIMIKESCPARSIGTTLGCFNLAYPIWAGLLQVLFGQIQTWSLTRTNDPGLAYQTALYLVLANVAIAVVCSFLSRETMPARDQISGGKSR